jgi:hypothetical protein
VLCTECLFWCYSLSGSFFILIGMSYENTEAGAEGRGALLMLLSSGSIFGLTGISNENREAAAAGRGASAAVSVTGFLLTLTGMSNGAAARAPS